MPENIVKFGREIGATLEVYVATFELTMWTDQKCKNNITSGGSSVSQNKVPQLILGYIYILKYLQSNLIG